MYSNQEAAMVFMQARGQIITVGMGQPIDLSIPAIKIVMDLYGVKDQKECLSKVLMAFRATSQSNG